MKAPKDLALLTPDCLPCAQPDPPSSDPAEVGRPIKSRRWLRCNILRHGQAQFFRVCDIVATVLGRHDPVLTRFPGPVQGSAAAGGIAAEVVRHGRYVTFRLAEVAIPWRLLAEILRPIAVLRPEPAPS